MWLPFRVPPASPERQSYTPARSEESDEPMTYPDDPTRSPRRRLAGFTLVELSVVIIVLFAFLSMLFIGARAWKRGSDRAGCVMNIRQMQMAVRAYANVNRLESGQYMSLLGPSGVPGSAIIGPDNFIEGLPSCPGMGIYTLRGNTVPAVGDLYMTCSLAPTERHEPEYHATW